MPKLKSFHLHRFGIEAESQISDKLIPNRLHAWMKLELMVNDITFSVNQSCNTFLQMPENVSWF